jgi:hypothetical protein
LAEALGDQRVESAGAVGEGVSLYAHSFLNGHEEISEGDVPVEGEVLPVLIAHIFSTSEDQGIVVVVVSLTVTAAVKNAGVVQYRPITLFDLA